MESHEGASRVPRAMLTAASFVIVVAGLKAAAGIVVPFLFALFLSIICSAPMFWLKKKGLATWFSILVVILGISLAGYVIGAILGSSINDFSQTLPAYSQRLNMQYSGMLSWLEGKGIDVSRLKLVNLIDAEKGMRLTAVLFNALRSMLGSGLLILLTVIFILLEASAFPMKIRAVFGDPDRSIAQMGRIADNVKHYLAIKTAMSLFTGVLVATFLAVMGVDFPLLWGLLSFLLNFIPNIGSIIAAVPAIIQALMQFGWGMAVGTLAGYLVIEVIMGNFVEPRFMGRGLGLSTLVVFLSLVFWGWVLGPIGMVLSVVLTVTVKIVLESFDETRWIAVLLGSKVPAPPPEIPQEAGGEAAPPASAAGEEEPPASG
ncbi:MAG: AI-2E family transporter [Candidatus Krumholzibacteria bacterium]|nr:AI-2E family transporter [Candidatus Krumholzibacteria bacterium]